MPSEDKFSSLGSNAYREYKQENIIPQTACLGYTYTHTQFFFTKQCISYHDEKENGSMAKPDKLTEIMCCSKH